MTNSWTSADLKNCKLENPSLVFGPQAQSISWKRETAGFQPLRHNSAMRWLLCFRWCT